MSLMLDAPPTPTLESIIGRAWYGIELDREVECPLCHGVMAPRWSAGSGIVGGRCEDCGTTLE